jgi:gamma-glutamylcyclotransferase
MSRLYFAYGSNMARHQMLARCPGAQCEGTGVLPGWRFFINRRGTASIRPDPSQSVHGVIWRIGPAHRITLDTYEGVRRGNYLHREISFESQDEFLRGFTYVGVHLQEGQAIRAYLEGVILPAAEDHGLPQDYIAALADWLPHRPIGPARPRVKGRSWKP